MARNKVAEGAGSEFRNGNNFGVNKVRALDSMGKGLMNAYQEGNVDQFIGNLFNNVKENPDK